MTKLEYYYPDWEIENPHEFRGDPLSHLIQTRENCYSLPRFPLEIWHFPRILLEKAKALNSEGFVIIHGAVGLGLNGLPYWGDGTIYGGWQGDDHDDAEITVVGLPQDKFKIAVEAAYQKFRSADKIEQNGGTRLRLTEYKYSNWVPPFYFLHYRKFGWWDPNWEEADGVYRAFDIHGAQTEQEFLRTYAPFYSGRLGYPVYKLGWIDHRWNPYQTGGIPQRILITDPEFFLTDSRSILNITRALVLNARAMLITGEPSVLADSTAKLMRQVVTAHGATLTPFQILDCQNRTGKSLRRVEAIHRVGRNKYQADEKRLILFRSQENPATNFCDFLNAIGYSKLIFGVSLSPTFF